VGFSGVGQGVVSGWGVGVGKWPESHHAASCGGGRARSVHGYGSATSCRGQGLVRPTGNNDLVGMLYHVCKMQQGLVVMAQLPTLCRLSQSVVALPTDARNGT
jgi:hypothetical protein